MIRINLLAGNKRVARPAAAAAPGGNTQVWAGVYIAAVIAMSVVCGVLYLGVSGEVESQIADNRTLESQIQDLRSRSARLEEVQAKLAESMALEEVVSDLSRGRTGPTRAMMELSKILSTGEGAGPTIDPAALEALRRDNPLATFNRSWDSRRLWLTTFEEDNRQSRIEGIGRSNEDVAEFLRRLQLSELFDGVTLQRTEAAADQVSGLELIKFELRCRVTY